MNTLKAWLRKNNIDETVVYVYEVDGEKVKLSFDQVLDGVIRKIRNEHSVINALNSINKYYESRKPMYTEKERIDEIENFLREMAMHVVYENKADFTWEDLSDQNGYSVDFLKWWMNEKEIKENQMLWDHDDQDTYDKAGTFYNSVGECKKCNCDCDNFLDRADIDLVWRAWNHK
jgi:hypothetical protein